MTLRHLLRATGTTVAISLPTIWEAAVGRLTAEACDRRLGHWSQRLLDQAGIVLEVTGLSNIPPNENFVVMSNHQSLYDIPVIFQALNRRIRMVTKRELFQIPLWGKAMHLAGFVEVDRQNRAQAIESMHRAAEVIRSGTDVWLSPEGTRSLDGSLGPFRKGGFHLARETGTRILPVTVVGTRAVLPAHGRRVQSNRKVRVFVHPPLATADFSLEELMAAVRNILARPLAEAEA